MGGFVDLVTLLAKANGLNDATITRGQTLPVLSGLFDPARIWDMLIFHQERLVAAVEFTAHIGPPENHLHTWPSNSLGVASDLWTAYRPGKLGEDAPRPFLGQLTLVEDTRHSPDQAGASVVRDHCLD